MCWDWNSQKSSFNLCFNQINECIVKIRSKGICNPRLITKGNKKSIMPAPSYQILRNCYKIPYLKGKSLISFSGEIKNRNRAVDQKNCVAQGDFWLDFKAWTICTMEQTIFCSHIIFFQLHDFTRYSIKILSRNFPGLKLMVVGTRTNCQFFF